MATLLADRFLRSIHGVTVDLASGGEVTIRVAGTESPTGQERWAARCAALYGCRHPHLIELADFGLLERHDRFEAYRLAAPSVPWARRDADTAGALRAVVAFLHRLGISAGPLAWTRVVDRNGTLKFVPDVDTGSLAVDEGQNATIERELESLERMLRSCRDGHVENQTSVGLVLQPRVVIRQVVEWIETTHVGAPSCVYLAAPPMAGVTTTLDLIAREARLRGFVPIVPALLAPEGQGLSVEFAGLADILATRHVVVLDDRVRLRETDAAVAREALSRALLELGTRSTRSVLAVVAVSPADSQQPRIDLDPLPQAALRHAVVLGSPASRAAGTAVAAASRAAEGRPGWFVRRLQKRLCPGGASPMTSVAGRVRESRPTYEGRAVSVPGTGSRVPAASSDVRVRELLNEGRRLADLGRHAPAERALRLALSGLARRNDVLRAGFAAVHLGGLLLDRGRAPAALEAFQRAHKEFQHAQATAGATCAAGYIGLAQTDQGKFTEGEAALRAAYVAAGNLGNGQLMRFARAGLARCLFWQRRYPEARAILDSGLEGESGSGTSDADLPGLTSSQQVRLLSVAARVALALEEVIEAGRLAQWALDSARDCGNAAALAIAHTAFAALHAKIGDVEALGLHVRQGLAAAGRAHAPLRALRLRLTLIEGCREAGETRQAGSFARRLASIRRLALPELLRDRVDAALMNLSGSPDVQPHRRPPGVREGSVIDDRSGAVCRPETRRGERSAVEGITEVLHLCHEVEDEQDALSRVALVIRKRTGAIAAGFFGLDARAAIPLVSLGSLQAQTARRAIDSGLVIAPERSAAGIEAAAPIRYAGVTMGAVTCRWGVEGPFDAERSAMLLTAAAAACAPLVRIVLDRRSTVPAVPQAGEFDLTGTSPAIAEVRRAIVRAGNAPFAVLIEGESGSGKELVARAIHRIGARRNRKFCPLNCAALSDELVEAELFGHARGAFTGAIAERAGLFEEADGGTILLDEISELSARAQAKLLRVLQEGEIRRIGENFARPIDARVIAATNRSLRAEVEAGRFRSDLFYRLDVIRIGVPPLRERVDDIPPLAQWFWRQATERIDSRAVLSQATVAALARYDWPGNVRELQNVLAGLAVSGPRRGIVGLGALPAALARVSQPTDGVSLEQARRLFEQRFVRAALARAAGHRGRTAASLGVSRQGFAKLMQRLGLNERVETGERDPGR